ncbi:MAG: putative transporter [Bacteroidales bacterium]|nr:putative transporter [Bacteroidales bacterium]
MILAFVVGIGLLLSKLKIKGVSLGATWILLVGLLFSALGVKADPLFLHFIKEFGLVLFVFAIGLQVGPAFFSSFRKATLKFNLLSLLMILLSVGCVLVLYATTGERLTSLVGSLTGAMTNTPGLGTAQQTYYDTVHGTFLAEVDFPREGARIASAFAVAYPIGMLGIILVIVFLRHIFRVDLDRERKRLEEGEDVETKVVFREFEVVNPAVVGRRLSEVCSRFEGDFAISEVRRGCDVLSVSEDPVLQLGDRIGIELKQREERVVRIMFGQEIEEERSEGPALTGTLAHHRLVLTKHSLNGKRLGDLKVQEKYRVTVSRIIRSGVSLVARDNLILQMGDALMTIGRTEDLNRFAEYVGNSNKDLDRPNLIPIFLGIGLGLIVGAIPFRIPALPHAVHLGIAGGVLLVAILLGHFGPKWRITTYTTASANKMLREIGLALMLATIGLSSGSSFAEAFRYDGLNWICFALVIAIVPALVTGLVARLGFKMNFYQICGVLCGSATNAPVLSFTQEKYGSDAIAVSYAAVFPVSLFLQVLIAQVLILFA